MFEWISSLFAIAARLPALAKASASGAVVATAEPGSTDQMTSTPAPSATPVRPSSARAPLTIDRTTLRLGPGQYIRQETEKSLVVLHFTAGGSAAGAFRSWEADARTVAAAYIVEQDGRVFETFDPRFWAYALGIKGAAGPANERRAVQIEIVNWGPLKRVGNYLCTWPKNWTNRYCHVGEISKYVTARYRGIEYFAAYPEAQISAVAALVAEVCDRFRIPRDLPPLELRGVCDVARFSHWRGIAAHESFRQDKWDVGPAFPWERLERELGR